MQIWGLDDEWLSRFEGEENNCFYHCSLPCDWCEEYCLGGAESFSQIDVVKKVVTVCGAVPIGLEILRRIAEEEFVERKKYKRWLEKGRQVFGLKSMNMFLLFTEICKR